MSNAPDAPQDFIGIESIVENIRVSRRSEESARFHVNLSIRVQGNGQLLAVLSEQMKNVVFTGFGFMQQTLPIPFPDPVNVPDNGVSTVAVSHVIAPNGDAILPHAFRKAKGKPNVCLICDLGLGHEIHADSARGKSNGTKADDNWPLHAFVTNDETPGLCKTCHHREDDDLHDPAKAVHVFEVPADGPVDVCGLCGGDMDDAIHEGAVSPLAQSLIEAIGGVESVEVAQS